MASGISHHDGTDSDISNDEADEPVPRKKRRISNIHSYVDKISNTEYLCNICSKVIRCSVGSNGNVRRHLVNVHGLSELKLKNDEIESKNQFDPYRKAVLDEAAINCIITDSRPFGDFLKTGSVYTQDGMKKFLSTALPGYVGPHENTVRTTIKNLYSTKLSELQEELKQVHDVCLTADLWRRPKQNHYLCVTVHYLGRNYRNISKVLSFRRFHGRHLSTRIRRHLTRVVNRFELQSKIVAFVTDNGSDMRAATQRSKIFGIRLYCLCHGLNLTIKNGLHLWKDHKEQDTSTDSKGLQNNKENHKSNVVERDEASNDEFNVGEQLNDELVEDEEEEERELAFSSDEDEINFDMEEDNEEAPRDDTDIVSSDEEMDIDNIPIDDNSFHVNNIGDILQSCRKIINIINKSSILYELCQNLARPTIKGHLSIDMRIRWNTTCTMLSKLIEYQLVLTQLMDKLPGIKGVSQMQKKVLVKLQFSNEQWEVAKILNSALSLFSEASDMLSGSRYPSYAVAYLVIDSLRHYLRSITTNHIEQTIKHELNQTFDQYVNRPFGSPEHNLLLKCAFLDPNVYQLMDDQEKVSVKKLLMTDPIMKNNAADYNNVTATTTDSPVNITSSKMNTSTLERFKLFRAKCGIADEPPLAATSKSLTLKEELAKYESLEKKEHSFATFWKTYERSFPILSKMARRYGCVPASSVPSESAFSVAGHVARKTRSSLTAKNL
ncbi:unnamed protein product, partial [Rotaria sp. Silwood1]